LLRADASTSTGAIVDNNRLFPYWKQSLSQQARDHIGRATRGKRHDNAH
jgi:hypothetical protein